MKKIFTISIAVLCLIACGGNSKKEVKNPVNTDVTPNSATSIAIGVVNTDSILDKYTFAIKARETTTKKAEDARLSLNTKARQLQQEMAEFQKKIENNAFLSRERAEQEASRLQKKEIEVRTLGETLEAQFMSEQQKLSLQLKDSIALAISEVNKDKRFAIIVSTSSLTDNVLYADEALNITNEILEFLNSRIKK
ncbi:MAG: OmpH family outer membrane protein [Porphyromonadaceae bacterium]|nr:OmpH family outer membrane protein [Porphyromonadaceae bacterium]